MKTIIQQEILIMTGTSFISRQCLQKKEDNTQHYSEIEQLLEACWNGVLPQILPEIFKDPGKNKEMYMWNVKGNKASIEIDLAEAPSNLEKAFSIDPYAFTHVQVMN